MTFLSAELCSSPGPAHGLAALWLIYRTGQSTPWPCWDKTAPSLLFEASVCKIKGREKSEEWRRRFPLTDCFALLNAHWHIHWTSTLSGEVSQGAGQLPKGQNKPLVVTSQPQKLPHLFFRLETQAGCNWCCLIYLGTHLPSVQLVPQIPYLPPSNWTFLWVGVKPSLPQWLEYHGHPLHMLCPAVTMDDDIIQVGSSICSVRMQHLIHEAFGSGWGF